MNKFLAELKLMQRKQALITTKLAILRQSIDVQEQLEELNNIFITVRTSNEIRQARQRWKNELERTEKEIDTMIKIIIKEASIE
jgi:hypothetical protein